MDIFEIVGVSILLAVLGAAVYLVLRLGGLDPHHVQATPGPFGTFAKTVFIIFVYVSFLAQPDKTTEFSKFLAAFVLAQLVAIAYTSPDRYREDEISDSFERWCERYKGPISGGMILTGLSTFLAWITPSFWFYIVSCLGLFLIFSKGVSALYLIDSDDGEFRNAPPSFRAQIRKFWGVASLYRSCCLRASLWIDW
ncbi:hypothetical protein HJ145_04230 [Vibrio parahaemolyticus]|nr:hypothetical protein [Vibrio parahaemolyticus]